MVLLLPPLPYFYTINHFNQDLIRWLLSIRSNVVNQSNNDGRCPLHIAALNNNVEVGIIEETFSLKTYPKKFNWSTMKNILN